MRRLLVVGFVLLAGAGVVWLQVTPRAEQPLANLLPAGALWTMEARDFGSLLTEWNQSPVKAAWLKSRNHEVFEQSNLLQKMTGVYNEYAQVVGFNPGLPQWLEVAGDRSVLALYNPRELEFLYISHVPDAKVTASRLWALRDGFEQRQSGGKTFYLHGTGSRTVAFAFSGDTLFAATREDLVGRALALQSGAAAPSVAAERWYAAATKAAPREGDLRMVLNLEALVRNTYFRSYWVQRNVSQWRPFLAEVGDIDRGGAAALFTERRMLVRQADAQVTVPGDATRTAMARLVAMAPADAGLYRAWAAPAAADVEGLIESKLLFPHAGAEENEYVAPVAPDQSDAGSESDLETRIDQAPAGPQADNAALDALKTELSAEKVNAVMEVESSVEEPGAALIGFAALVAIENDGGGDGSGLRAGLKRALTERISTGGYGMDWVAASEGGETVWRLNGLAPLYAMTRGPITLVANDQRLLASVAAGRSTVVAAGTPLDTYAAGFRHGRERAHYLAVMRALDRVTPNPGGFPFISPASVDFFSGNLGSLSEVLAGIAGMEVRERASAEGLQQVVIYRGQ